MQQVLDFRFFNRYAQRSTHIAQTARPALCGLAVAALTACALPFAASAQTHADLPPVDAANAQAVVPRVVYRSVFQETSLGVEKDNTDWRKANDDVGKFLRGHVDILKQEEQEGATKPIAAPAHQH